MKGDIIRNYMLASLAKNLSDLLDKSILSGGNEPKIIENFVKSAQRFSGGPRILIESVFVHQKPYAFFHYPPSICGKKKTELGDILFIIKRKRASKVIDHRFTFVQAKKMSSKKANIEVHQFRFYRDIDLISFYFGNNVHKVTGITQIIWKHLTKSNFFGSYLFLDIHRSISVETSLVDAYYPGGCKSFTFNTNIQCSPPWLKCRLGLMPFECFLLRFLKLKGIGVSALNKPKNFLEIVLKRVGLSIDPPEETEGYFEEDEKGGFGVIRITINEEENF